MKITKCSIVCLFSLALVQVSAQEQGTSIFKRLKEKQADQATAYEPILTKEELAFKEQLDAELKAYTVRHLKEFTEFKNKYNADLMAYRSQILEVWGEVDVSTNTKLVDYTEDNVKTVVDFEQHEVVVSVIHNKDEKPDINKVERAVARLSKLTPSSNAVYKSDGKAVNVIAELVDDDVAKVITNDPAKAVSEATKEQITPSIDAEDVKVEEQEVARIQEKDKQQIEIIADKTDIPDDEITKVQASLVNNSSMNVFKVKDSKIVDRRNKLKEKRITRYKIAVNGKSDTTRVNKVKPYADLHAAKWKLPLELIIAIIHTESSFNPLAVSHIPAYGLMQIVPNSAGIDVNEFLNAKREPMATDVLFISEQNILAGSAYLHLLDNRYLKKISNKTSRMYCVIAAYNTGVGNVSRAFNLGKSRRLDETVVLTINSMEPEQVYQQLVERLPYEETRRYLKKVRGRMTNYQKILQSIEQSSI